MLGIAASVLHPSRPSFGTLVFWYFRVDLGTFWYFRVDLGTFGYIWVLFGTFPFPFNQEVQVDPLRHRLANGAVGSRLFLDICSIQEVLSGQSKVRSSVLALHNFAPGTLC